MFEFDIIDNWHNELEEMNRANGGNYEYFHTGLGIKFRFQY